MEDEELEEAFFEAMQDMQQGDYTVVIEPKSFMHFIYSLSNQDPTDSIIYTKPFKDWDMGNLADHLREANLAFLMFSGNGLTREHLQRITESIVEGSVVVLGLKDNKIRDDGFEHIAALVAANRPTRGLVVSGNKCKDSGGDALAAAMIQNKYIVYLDLDNNRISNKGASAFGIMLRTNNTLTSLDLQRNHIGEPGATAIANSLAHNQSLIHLFLQGNEIKRSWPKFREAINSNPGSRMQQLDVSHNGATPASIDSLQHLRDEKRMQIIGIDHDPDDWQSFNFDDKFSGNYAVDSLSKSMRNFRPILESSHLNNVVIDRVAPQNIAREKGAYDTPVGILLASTEVAVFAPRLFDRGYKTVASVLELTDEELRELGVRSNYHRNKLREVLQRNQPAAVKRDVQYAVFEL